MAGGGEGEKFLGKKFVGEKRGKNPAKWIMEEGVEERDNAREVVTSILDNQERKGGGVLMGKGEGRVEKR